MIVCFNFFLKHSSRLLYSSRPISSSFSVRFGWFKTWWVHQLGLYKTSLYSRSKDATIKDFKLEIQICSNSPTTEHYNIPPTPNTPYLPHSFIELSNFCKVGSARWRATNFLWSSNEEENMWGFELLWVLKCSLTGIPNCPLLPEWTPVYYEQRYCPILGFRV